MLKPGTIVADKYRLERVLGRGGMGMVIEARHVQLGTPFALKFLHRSIAGNASVPERFLREARAAAALGSEHVCRVFDVGTFDGVPFLVMELLEGTDLEVVLRLEKRLAPRVACGYLIQACAGIAEAHAAQIVHRDLKPGNLFLAARAGGTPLVKVLDFGIAKAPQETELGLTGTDTVLGSPAYMSLEQLRSSRLVDTRSDIWSLGVILFELVSGRRPFQGEGIADLALRIHMEPVPSLPGGPAELDVIVGRCLARDPAERYRDVGELALALAPFADEPDRRLARSLGRASRASTPPAPAPRDPDPHATVLTHAPRLPQTYPVISIEASSPDPERAPDTLQAAGAIERRPAARRSRWIGPVVLAASAVGGISLGIAATRGDDASPGTRVALHRAEPAEVAAVPPPPPPPSPSLVVAPPSRPAVAAAPQPAPTITLRFALDPAGAAIELDDVFVTARQIKVHKDDELHRLRISAPGFTAYEGTVRFDESQKLTLRLVRPASRPAPPSPSRIESKSPYE